MNPQTYPALTWRRAWCGLARARLPWLSTVTLSKVEWKPVGESAGAIDRSRVLVLLVHQSVYGSSTRNHGTAIGSLDESRIVETEAQGTRT